VEHRFSPENENLITFIKKTKEMKENNGLPIQDYFSIRIFQFLKKLNDLKYLPSDEKSLYLYDLFT
jgi:hypothetical protein